MGLMYVNSMFQGVQYIFSSLFIYFFPFSALKEKIIPRKQGLLKFPVN